MTSATKENLVLPGLREADDLPHPVSAVKGWSENYLSSASFPAAGASLWLHHGRTAWDPSLWQEIFVFYLPGDRYLVSKATARTPADRGPRGAGLYYRCDEPFRRWTKTFQGGARLVTGDELRAGALTDGRSVGVELTLEWLASTPAFTMDTSEQSWTDAHYEQHCAVAGTLRWSEGEFDLTGTGLRDHSWGHRDFSRIGRHCWIHASWRDGRSFMIFHHESADGHTLSHVTVDHGSGAVPARFTGEVPLVDSLEEGLSGYTLELRTADGRDVVIEATVEQSPTLCMIGTCELGLGACPEASHWLSEAQTRFSWNGSAQGLTERTIRR